MTNETFDADDAATTLIEVATFMRGLRSAVEEARQLGSPDIPALARQFNAASVASSSFLNDLDQTPRDALQVISVLVMKAARATREVMRDHVDLFNAGNKLIVVETGRYTMVVPDREDAARLLRLAEQSVSGSDDLGATVSQELAAIAAERQYNLSPVITSLVETIVSREAVRGSE